MVAQKASRRILFVALLSGMAALVVASIWLGKSQRRELQGQIQLAEGQLAQFQKEAEEAKQQAQDQSNAMRRSREQTEGLIDFFLSDLYEQLEPIGKVALLEDSILKIQAYFDKQPLLHVSPMTELNRSSVYANIGEIRYTENQMDEAMKAMDEAIKIRESLVEDHPKNLDFVGHLAKAYESRGIFLRAVGSSEAALDSLEQARSVFEKISSEHPGDAECLNAQLEVCQHLGLVHRDLHNEELTEKFYRRALEFGKRILEIAPEDPRFIRNVAVLQANVGHLHLYRSEVRESETLLLAALATLDALSAPENQTVKHQALVAGIHGNLGAVYRRLLREDKRYLEKAISSQDHDLVVRQGLVAEDPRNIKHLVSLARSYYNRMLLMFEIGERDEAAKCEAKCFEIAQEISKKSGIGSEAARLIGNTAESWSLRLEEPSAKKTYLRARLSNLEELFQDDPSSEACYDVCVDLLARLRIQVSDDSDAVAALDRRELGLLAALKIPLVEKRGRAAPVWGMQAKTLQARGENERALAAYRISRWLYAESGNSRGWSQFQEPYWELLRDVEPESEVSTWLSPGAKWFYTTKAPAAEWVSAEFDFSNWNSGEAPLGYGNGNEATDIAKNAEEKPLVLWVRTQLPERVLQDGETRILGVRRDDGIVVYLDEEEVVRDNLPQTELATDTLATQLVDGPEEEEFVYFPIPRGAGGEAGILAAAVFQSSLVSSDLTFDLSLTVVKERLSSKLSSEDLSSLAEILGEAFEALLSGTVEVEEKNVP